ncbi:MAG: cation-translocating P-type ATPase [candidate division WOR-3 bacterium]
MADWHLKSIQEVVRELGSDLNKGLSSEEVRRRLNSFGRNELKEQGVRTPLSIFLSQFKSILIIILIVASVISLFMREFIDAIAIFAIVLLNSILGFVQDFRAERTMQALKRLAVPKVRVRRDGHIMEVSARELVPGDIVLLEAGVHIPADGRLIEAVNLRVSEATLTGESEPVDKSIAIENTKCKMENGDEIPLVERKNMVYMGTAVVAGRGAMIVTTTGMNTELGKIAEMLQTVKREQTPLEKRLVRLSKELAVGVLIIVGVIFVIGVMRGGDLKTMFLVAVSMAVAAVPEGLPAVVTITQTLGARRMLTRNALIRRLNAVETLGSVTVICSDKTGTLTQNRMTVTMLDVAGDRLELSINDGERVRLLQGASGQAFVLLIAGGVLCNDAVMEERNGGVKVIGDPTEGALVVLGARFGLTQEVLHKLLPRIAEVPFSSERKRMSTIHRLEGNGLSLDEARGNELLLLETLREFSLDGGRFVFTKGAVDVILELSASVLIDSKFQSLDEEWRARIIEGHNRLTQNGMRVLGVAFRPLKDIETEHCPEMLEKELCFVGMIGMIDPARPEVKDAVRECRQAGIRPVMITGDHPLTAMYIASDIGVEVSEEENACVTGADLAKMSVEELKPIVARTNVFARVAPEHKLKIVMALQSLNEVVAMTGDGVNDAPALKKADIGVAMGITGTDVAKEAAEMVLLDDNFATIVAAVKEGRTIYDNIKKFIRYTFASNAGEIIVMLIAPFFGMPLALTPLQILWVNLVTDGLPGLALGIEGPERDVMRKPPRPLGESIFAHGMAFNIIWSGVFLGLLSFFPGWWAWRNGNPAWQTIIFTVLTMGQLFHSLSLRSQRESVFTFGFFTNRTLIGTFITTLILQLGLIYLPIAQRIFQTHSLPLPQLLIILALSSMVFWVVELEKLFRRHFQ